MSQGGGFQSGGGANRLGSMGARTGPIFQAPSNQVTPTSPGSSGKSKKNRACLACKSGHLKCDHGMPSCSRCVQKKVQCVYSEAAPVSPRPFVFVDHAFDEATNGVTTMTTQGDDFFPAERTSHYFSSTSTSGSQFGRSPSSSDYTMAHTLPGTSPLSATGLQNISITPNDNPSQMAVDATSSDYYPSSTSNMSSSNLPYPPDQMDFSGFPPRLVSSTQSSRSRFDSNKRHFAGTTPSHFLPSVPSQDAAWAQYYDGSHPFDAAHPLDHAHPSHPYDHSQHYDHSVPYDLSHPPPHMYKETTAAMTTPYTASQHPFYHPGAPPLPSPNTNHAPPAGLQAQLGGYSPSLQGLSPSIPHGLSPSQQGLSPSQQGLSPSQQGLSPSQQGLSPSQHSTSSLQGSASSLSSYTSPSTKSLSHKRSVANLNLSVGNTLAHGLAPNSKINPVSPPQSPKRRHRKTRGASQSTVARTTPNTVSTGQTSSAPSSSTSSAGSLLTGSTVTPAYSQPSSPHTPHTLTHLQSPVEDPYHHLGASPYSYSYGDGNSFLSGSSTHNSSPHSYGPMGPIGPPNSQGGVNAHDAWDYPPDVYMQHGQPPHSLHTSVPYASSAYPRSLHPTQHQYPLQYSLAQHQQHVSATQTSQPQQPSNSTHQPSQASSDYSQTFRQHFPRNPLSPLQGRDCPLVDSGNYSSLGGGGYVNGNDKSGSNGKKGSFSGSSMIMDVQSPKLSSSKSVDTESDSKTSNGAGAMDTSGAPLTKSSSFGSRSEVGISPSSSMKRSGSNTGLSSGTTANTSTFSTSSSSTATSPVPTRLSAYSSPHGSQGGQTNGMTSTVQPLSPGQNSVLSSSANLSNSTNSSSDKHAQRTSYALSQNGQGSRSNIPFVRKGNGKLQGSSSSNSSSISSSSSTVSANSPNISQNQPLGDDLLADLLQVLDAFVSIFETRAPVNLAMNWTPQDSKPYWMTFMAKDGEKDDLNSVLASVKKNMASGVEAEVGTGVKIFLRFYEQCVVLLCGASSITWTAVETPLSKQCEKMTTFLTSESITFDSEEFHENECERFADALSLYATYLRDRQATKASHNALLMAYTVLTSNVHLVSQDAAERLSIWTMFIISSPQERNHWLGMLAKAGFSQGNSPMAVTVTQQSNLVSRFSSGAHLDDHTLNEIWSQLDELETIIHTIPKIPRSRPFRYMRVAAVYLLRIELYYRWNRAQETIHWVRFLQDIVAMSPGLKISVSNTIKAVLEPPSPDGESRGFVCASHVLHLLDQPPVLLPPQQ